jgi:hypothetical protein
MEGMLKDIVMPKFSDFDLLSQYCPEGRRTHIAMASQLNAIWVLDLLNLQRIGNYVIIVPRLLSEIYVERQSFVTMKVNIFVTF